MQTSQVGILACLNHIFRSLAISENCTVNIASDTKFKIIEQVLKNEINDIKIKCLEVCYGNS